MKIEFTIFRDLLYIFVGNTKSTLDFFVGRRLDERKKMQVLKEMAAQRCP